jgi:hypothetical protein
MKQVHIHVNTEKSEFANTVDFYSTLFDSKPTKSVGNYAKWMLEDPKVNFVVEAMHEKGDIAGIHHVGIQTEDSSALEEVKLRLKENSKPVLEVGKTECCYSESEKNWTMDPNGVRWETFYSEGDIEDYGRKTDEELALYNITWDSLGQRKKV